MAGAKDGMEMTDRAKRIEINKPRTAGEQDIANEGSKGVEKAGVRQGRERREIKRSIGKSRREEKQGGPRVGLQADQEREAEKKRG